MVLLNGSNSDAASKKIYSDWLEKHQNTGRVSGSRTADMKAALVEKFRDEGTLMICTEAGAEGINLQFCSLLINYDLPWNPQRVEQRIGRVHRYGQKHDVVVVNFINKGNRADQRVFELLSQKFQLLKAYLALPMTFWGQLNQASTLSGVFMKYTNTAVPMNK